MIIGGKQWHETKKAFRPTSGLTSYKQRIEQQKRMAVTKLVEKEMKEEKESKRQVQLKSVHVDKNEAYGVLYSIIFKLLKRDEKPVRRRFAMRNWHNGCMPKK